MKKKVLHLLASNSYSGAENVVCTIIDNCSDKYDMYYCSLDGTIRDILEKRNIKFIPLKRLSIFELKKIIKDYKIDIIHAHDYKASFISVFFNVRIISQLHLNWDFSTSWNIYTIVYRLIMHRFSKIIAVSKEIVDEAVFSKNKSDKFTVLTNVINKNEVLKKGNEFESTYYDLVFVGRLTKIKRPEIVIEITKRLREKYPSIRTCIIGGGELERNCRELVKKYNLEDNVEMLGFKENPFPYVKNSKVALMPSSHEGLGLVAIESMILGTIVINSGAGGLKTIFHNHSKYICKEIDDYVNKIDELLKVDKNTYKDDCNKMIKKFTDIKKYKKRLLSIYEDIL